ncbi:hypothetical protein ACS0TY_000357 [Phlomoides rotata]
METASSSRQFWKKRNSRENLDRFISNRSAMDFDYARYMLTGGGKENRVASSPAYRKLLEEALSLNRSRILAFRNKPPMKNDIPTFHQAKSSKPRRHIPLTWERTLDAPDLLDDYYLNLLDWGSKNVLSIALGSTVYLWDGSTSELVTIDEEMGPVTSVKFAPDGRQIAVGLNNSQVQIWDSTANNLLRTLRGGHVSRVGAMDWKWNNQILTTGGMDGKIFNNDPTASGWPVEEEIISFISGTVLRQWLHRHEEHTTAVKALAWCPYQANVLTSGGSDRCIKLWNTHTSACFNSVDTGSQVCALLWNKNKPELLSSHGFTQNQLTLWKYPSMVKMAELTSHTSRVLYMAQSPDGCTVASAAGDETLRFWNVFEMPQVAKPKPKTTAPEPFAHVSRIR